MNGKYLVKLVQSLTDLEWDHVKQLLRVDDEGVDSSKLVLEVRMAGDFDRRHLSKALGVSETTVSRIVPKVCQAIIQGLGFCQADQELELDVALNSAWKLVFRMADDTASVLIQDLYSKSEAIERFDILFQCQRLIEASASGIEVEGISKEELTRKQSNIWQYHELFSKAKNLKTASVVRKQVLIQELESSDLLQSEVMALSVTARATYLGIHTRLCFFQNDLAGARASQLKLIDLFETHRWLSRYHDFFLAREYKSLIPMLIENNQTELANSMLMNVARLGQDSKLGKQNTWQQLYPTRLMMQLAKGDIENGKHVTEEILTLIENEQENLPITFVHQNLYYIAYFFISIAENEKAQKLLFRIMRKSKEKDFLPNNWAMVRILKAVLTFELRDEIELRDQIKNIRQTNFYQESPYFKFVLRCLIGLSGQKSNSDIINRIDMYLDEAFELGSDPLCNVLFAYFDIRYWLISKRQNRPMIAVLSESLEEYYSSQSKSRDASS